jgi:hypothetical protein
MTRGRPRDPRKEHQWRRLIQQWQDRGLAVADFCARHGLSQPTFYAWRRKLKQRPDPQRADSRPLFLPVRLAPEHEPAPGGPVEVVLPGGLAVRVRPGFDAPTLRRVVDALEEDRPC